MTISLKRSDFKINYPDAIGPEGWFSKLIDDLEALDLLVSETGSDIIWVDGGRTDNYVEDGSRLRPYKVLLDGLGAVTSTRFVVAVLPGAYELDGYNPNSQTAGVPNLHIVGSGNINEDVVISNSAGEVFTLNLFVGSAGITDFTLRNLKVEATGGSAVTLRNQGATAALSFNAIDCIIRSTTTRAILTTQIVGTEAINVNITRQMSENVALEGTTQAINFACDNTANENRISGVRVSGTIATTFSTVTSKILLSYCELDPVFGSAGGDAAHTFVVANCFTNDGSGTFDQVRSSDFAGSHSFKIIPESPTATGQYTGDGNATQAITGLGFTPVRVDIITHVTVAGNVARHYWRTVDMTLTQDVTSGTAEADQIVSFDSDGFTVGDDVGATHPNATGQVYDFVAWSSL
jgi:hypothetical protein